MREDATNTTGDHNLPAWLRTVVSHEMRRKLSAIDDSFVVDICAREIGLWGGVFWALSTPVVDVNRIDVDNSGIGTQSVNSTPCFPNLAKHIGLAFITAYVCLDENCIFTQLLGKSVSWSLLSAYDSDSPTFGVEVLREIDAYARLEESSVS